MGAYLSKNEVLRADDWSTSVPKFCKVRAPRVREKVMRKLRKEHVGTSLFIFVTIYGEWFSLANVNSSSCSLYVIVRPSVCRL